MMKDKQAEAIIEKLCQRFRLATDERQWRDIAFCLSLLPYKSERSMKKLIEGYVNTLLHELITVCHSTRISYMKRGSSRGLMRS